MAVVQPGGAGSRLHYRRALLALASLTAAAAAAAGFDEIPTPFQLAAFALAVGLAPAMLWVERRAGEPAADSPKKIASIVEQSVGEAI